MEENRINMTDQRICLFGGEDLHKLRLNHKELVRLQNTLGEVIVHAWSTHRDLGLLIVTKLKKDIVVARVSKDSVMFIKQKMTAWDMFVTADGTLMTVNKSTQGEINMFLAFGDIGNIKRKEFAKMEDVMGIKEFCPFRIFDGGGFELNKYKERMGAFW